MIQFTTVVDPHKLTLCTTPEEVGEWMTDCALSEWYNYNDEGTFTHSVRRGSPGPTVYEVSDPDMGKSITFTALEFFEKHVELIWLAQITNYRHDWIDFAFKSHGVDADEYDANTCDAVLQNMLYGEIVYG